MKNATIDLTDCKYLMELHERIKTGLHLDDGYGRNMDAFWDEINRNIQYKFITVKGSKTVSKDLLETTEIIKDILEKNKQYWKQSEYPFDYKFVD